MSGTCPECGHDLCVCADQPRAASTVVKYCDVAMVLTYYDEVKHSVWVDFRSRHKTRESLEARLRRGVRKGEWVGWRIITVCAQELGRGRSRNGGRDE